MFTIIGGDGREYGPATADQIRGWIAAGRANLDTKARALGSEEWRRLGDFAEFGAPDATPPVLTAPPPEDAEPAAAAPAARLAGIGARTGAALINAVVYFVSLLPGSMLLSVQFLRLGITPEALLRGERPDLTALAPGLALAWGGLLAACLVQAVLIAWRGQNLGKLMVGLRVVRAADGGPAGFVQGALLRFLLPVAVMFLLNVVPGLGFLFLLVDYSFMFGGQRRCLHDLVAGTKVIEA